MGSETDGSGIVGTLGLNDDTSEFNIMENQIDQALGKIGTVKLVKIMGVKNAGELSPVGFVDIKIMVNLVDGLLGSSMQHDTIFNVPYFRLQGGKNAIIMDPIVGDIGYAVIADRDISTVKQTKDVANPGSFRRFSAADAIYIGGILNDTPEQYIQFNADGITIADKNSNKQVFKSTGIDINGILINQSGQVVGNLAVTGALALAGSITALDGSEYSGTISTSGDVMAGTISLKTHRTLGVTTGGGTSGLPTP